MAIAKVSSNVNLTARIVYTSGTTIAATNSVTTPTTLHDFLFGSSANLETSWRDIHWISMVGDQPFYFNGGASADGHTVSTTPDSDDWYCAAGVELRVP